MLELHNGNVQYNDLSINNIMPHWESDGSLKIWVRDWECMPYMGENIESLWHVETNNAKEKSKERWWVAPELFGVQRRRQQDRPNYYTKEAVAFTVGKVTSQLYNQGHT